VKPLKLLGSFLLEDGVCWADAAAPFQVDDARQILEGDAPYTFTVRSRGSSKTTDLAGCAVVDLLVAPPRSRAYWAAADVEQAGLMLDVIGGFAARSPELAAAIDIQSRRVVVRETGSTLEALPADASSAFGLRPWRLYLDELAAWPDTPNARRFLDALTTSATKVPGARMAVLTAAGSPSHYSYKLLEHARAHPLWRALERTGPPPWIDEARLEEQRKRLPDSVYMQLFEAQWTEVEGSFLTADVVDAAFVLSGPALRPEGSRSYTASLDLGHTHDATVFAIGHLENEAVILDGMQTWSGSKARPVSFSEVEEHIHAAHTRFKFELSVDPWQALHVAERLRKQGIRTKEVTFSPAYKQRLASTLLQALNDGVLHLYPAEGLREELMALRLKAGTAGSWTFDHASGGHDDRAVALAMMAVAALEKRSATVGMVDYRAAMCGEDADDGRDRDTGGLPSALAERFAEINRNGGFG
jgi:hypothetical protein